MQINLTGFLTNSTSAFMEALWTLLIEAHESPAGIPRTFVEAKKEEMKKAREGDSRALDERDRRARLDEIRDREREGRGGRARGRGRGRGRGGGYDDNRGGRGRDGGWGGRGGGVRSLVSPMRHNFHKIFLAAPSIIEVSQEATFARSRFSLQYKKFSVPLIQSSAWVSLPTSIIHQVTI
jgi:PWI domain